jgi:hypothetical protein
MSKTNIQIGDTVTLIDKPWESEVWGALPRYYRADYMKCAGQEWTVERTQMMYNPVRELCACGDHKGILIVPLCLLRKAKHTTLTWVDERPNLTKRDALPRGTYPEFKTGTKFIVVDEKYRTDIKLGEIVTLWVNDDSGAPIFQKQDGKNAIISWQRLAQLEPAKHRYTPEQEQEARDIVYRLVMKQDCTVAIYLRTEKTNYLDAFDRPNYGRPHTIAIQLLRASEATHDWIEDCRAVAFCSPHDEWSDDVGRCVALCKLLGEPLPVWIRGDRS